MNFDPLWCVTLNLLNSDVLLLKLTDFHQDSNSRVK